MKNDDIIQDSIFDMAEESFENYNANKDFTTLDAWKNTRIVKLFFYKEIIPRLPESEKFNLTIQIQKSAVSITANIAEGYGRYHHREGIQFYRISRGSLYELKDHLISCKDLEYINENEFNKGIELIEKAKMVLNGYINFIKSQIK